jgi:dolichol-phosphate mannosyltransferase
VVVVPTYNECDNVEALVRRVLEAVREGHILIVDDNSPDGTGEIADDLASRNPGHVSVLHRRAKGGLGAAYVAGYLHALDQWPNAEYFVQMDADLSHDPRYIPALLDAMRTCDVAIGSRYVRGVSIVNWPLRRLIVSRLGTAFARTVTGMPTTDLTSGFKCFRAEVLRAIDLGTIRSTGYVFQVETVFRAWRMGYTLKDVPIIFYERETGESKLNLAIAFEAFTIVLRLGMERVRRRPRTKPAATGTHARH